MATLWLKFPDEVLLRHYFTKDTCEKLEHIFSNTDPASSWMKALSLLGIKAIPSTEPIIKWHRDIPYYNWSYYTAQLSGGSVSLNKTPDGGYAHVFSSKSKHVVSLIASQWKVARFLAKAPVIEDRLVESIALGIALQGLIIRLGSDYDKMADWLASSEQVPKKHRKSIAQIQTIQLRRTEISDVWADHFIPSEKDNDDYERFPAHFWDDDIPDFEKSEPSENVTPDKKLWKGKSVKSGAVTGVAVLVGSQSGADRFKEMDALNAPVVLIFKSARPETTELFEHAGAIIFCSGGVLSHACTVARDMNIPCVTALGADFYKYVQNQEEKLWLQVDAGNASVQVI